MVETVHTTYETRTDRVATSLRMWAPLPLRLVFGFGFLYHGYPKLFTAEGNEAFVGTLTGIGFPTPGLFAYLVGALEFFGGIMLMLGIAVRIISALGVVEMTVAALMVHASYGFNFINIVGMEGGAPRFGMPGYEVPLLYAAGFLSLLLSGGGVLSLPGARQEETEEYEEPEVVGTRR